MKLIMLKNALLHVYHFTSFTDGVVSTLTRLDFETDPSCTMVVTVFDGSFTSTPKTLTIDVSDVDEAPVIAKTGFMISTNEVAVRENTILTCYMQMGIVR